MDKVSIIVPVYKVERYLERCVHALTNQTYPSIEIVLVDDGSPDSSGLLCDTLAETDQRIVVIHQVNQGVSAARNNGIERSSGDWLCFCDGDDWFEPNFVEKMMKCATNEKADYIICNYKIAAEGRADIVSGNNGGLYSGCDPKTVVAVGPISSWTHMIRRDLFKKAGVCYPVGCKQYEELPVIPVLAKYAERIGVVADPLYNYFQRGDGTSASNASAETEDNFRKAFAIMCEHLGEEYRLEAEYHAIYALLYGSLLSLCKNKASAFQIRQKITEFTAEFPHYRENPYLAQLGKAKALFFTFAAHKCVLGLRLLSWVHGKITG